MAQFNLNDYETVEERLRRFFTDNPDARVITHNETTDADRAASRWVVRAEIFLTAEEQSDGLAKATGMAFEVDGSGMANKTAALENCETSAIGRALANAGYSGNKRASREEMEKVARSQPQRNFLAQAKEAKSVEALRLLWAEAKAHNADKNVLDGLQKLAEEFDNTRSERA